MQELTEHSLANLAELTFVLTKRKKPTVVLLTYDRPKLQKAVSDALSTALPDNRFYDLKLGGESVESLVAMFRKKLPEGIWQTATPTTVVHVLGIENSLFTSSEGRLRESALIANMNFERELYYREMPFTTLIWTDRYFFERFGRQAPDMWGWVNYTFHFESATNQVNESPVRYEQKLEKRGAIPERSKRIEELENQLAELPINDHSERNFLERINLLQLLGQEYEEQFAYPTAKEKLQEALLLAESVEDYNPAHLHLGLATVLLWARSFEAALVHYQKCLNLVTENNYGVCYHRIGIVYQEQEKWSTAIENFNKAIEWNSRTGNQFQIGSSYHHIGIVYQRQEKWSTAIENFNKAIEWFSKTGNQFEIGGSYHQIGRVYQEQEKWSTAIENFNKAIEWDSKTGNQFEIGGSYHHIGRVYEEQKKWSTAIENFNRAIEWYSKTGNQFHIGGSYHHIGRVYQEQEKWGTAIENFNKAIEWYSKTGNQFEIGDSYHHIGIVYQKQEKWNAAIENFNKAIEWNSRTGNQFQIGGSYHQIGRVYQEQEKWSTAIENFNKAIEWNSRTGNQFQIGRSCHQIGRVYEEQKKWSEAKEWFLKALKSLSDVGREEDLPIVEASLQRVVDALQSKNDSKLE